MSLLTVYQWKMLKTFFEKQNKRRKQQRHQKSACMYESDCYVEEKTTIQNLAQRPMMRTAPQAMKTKMVYLIIIIFTNFRSKLSTKIRQHQESQVSAQEGRIIFELQIRKRASWPSKK